MTDLPLPNCVFVCVRIHRFVFLLKSTKTVERSADLITYDIFFYIWFHLNTSANSLQVVFALCWGGFNQIDEVVWMVFMCSLVLLVKRNKGWKSDRERQREG